MPETQALATRPARTLSAQRTKAIVNLQRRLWGRTISENPSIVVMACLLGLYGVGAQLMASVLIADQLLVGNFTILIAACGLGTLLYLLLGIVMPSAEGRLQPQAYAIYPLRASDLRPGAAICLLMQVRAIIALGCTLTTAVVGAVSLARGGLAGWIVPLCLGMIAALLVTIGLGEVVSGLLGASSTRVSRERSAVVGSVGMMVVILGFNALSSGWLGHTDGAQITIAGQVAGWTLAAGPGAVASFASGDVLGGLERSVVVVAILAGLVKVWTRQLDEGLTEPLGQAAASAKKAETVRGQAVPTLLPGLRWGVGPMIFSRAARYLARDSRLLSSIVMYPMLAVMFLVMGQAQGSPFMSYFGLYFLAISPATYGSNDFGYDGPSNWLHLASNVPARTLLRARHLAGLVPGGITMLVYLIGLWVLTDDPVLMMILTVGAIGVFCSSSGVGVLLSVFNPYPMSAPGTNPWGDRSGFSSAAFLSAFGAMLISWLPVAPGVVVALIGYTQDAYGLVGVGCVLTIVIALAALIAAQRAATAKLGRNYPEIFEKVRRYT